MEVEARNPVIRSAARRAPWPPRAWSGSIRAHRGKVGRGAAAKTAAAKPALRVW